MIDEKCGRVVKGLGGLYETLVTEGAERTRYLTRAKGSLKRDEEKVLVGDLVKLRIDSEVQGGSVISEVLPRKNELIRPPLANLDVLFIVFAAAKPAPVYETLDKLIAIAEHNSITPVCVITKADLNPTLAGEHAKIYGGIGIDCFITSSLSGEGTEALAEYVRATLGGRTAAFAGASGVGKSTLLNALFPTLELATAEISRKIERGRHTTRHVEIFEIPTDSGIGYLADTPGFSLIDFARFDFFGIEDLSAAFREFSPYLDKCKYADCTHVGEGECDCAVVRAVKEGAISPSRHASYAAIREVLRAKKTYSDK